MSKAPSGIVFLDFDHTILHGDIGPLFGDYLVNARYWKVRERDGARAALRDRARLLARYTPYLAWLGVQVGLYKARAVRRSKLTRYAYKALKGVPADEYYGLMPEFVESEVPKRLYGEVIAAIEEHQKAGRQIVVITTGVQTLVEACLPLLPEGVRVIGCRLHERDGKLTGKVDGPLYGADKANIIHAYCDAAGVDIADCWAYSDHYSDFHMLEAVGNAVCINPRQRLRTMAEEKGWTVMEPKAPVQLDAE